ncbi:DUF928 domain-containing protein [Anthocerotibacter panamensis]|uniref:DUF928 domain-containing protein n=1 Tax=Anthocerotibacter panamensis TaxID=2857077 RepID=UPI001C405810|nr:DUF928 domain-containing protein [Anthocerotibacter panamensis]
MSIKAYSSAFCKIYLGFLVLSCLPAQAYTPPAPPTVTQGVSLYTIQLGDNLWSVARRYATSLRDLLKTNPQIEDPDLIFVGQKLLVPGTTLVAVSSTNTTSTTKVVSPSHGAKPLQIKKVKTHKRVAQKPPVPVAIKPVQPSSKTIAVIAQDAPSPAPVRLSAQPKLERRRSQNYLALNLPDRGLPGNREGAAKRGGGCAKPGNSTKLTALLPATNLGQTTNSYPTFFWYTPELESKYEPVNQVKFKFKLSEVDAQDPEQDASVVYRTEFTNPGYGITGFTLPSNAQPLAVGKDYRWILTVVCNAEDRSEDMYVQGWVRRVAPEGVELATKLQQADPADYPAVMAEAGMWYDALKYLVALRRVRPADETLKTDWDNLLGKISLEKIANQPLSCVAPNIDDNGSINCAATPPTAK